MSKPIVPTPKTQRKPIVKAEECKCECHAKVWWCKHCNPEKFAKNDNSELAESVNRVLPKYKNKAVGVSSETFISESPVNSSVQREDWEWEKDLEWLLTEWEGKDNPLLSAFRVMRRKEELTQFIDQALSSQRTQLIEEIEAWAKSYREEVSLPGQRVEVVGYRGLLSFLSKLKQHG